MNFSNGLIDNNKLSEKLSSMICNLSVSPSIMILPMDLLTTKIQKKNLLVPQYSATHLSS